VGRYLPHGAGTLSQASRSSLQLSVILKVISDITVLKCVKKIYLDLPEVEKVFADMQERITKLQAGLNFL
jgi:hypothetical protein